MIAVEHSDEFVADLLTQWRDRVMVTLNDNTEAPSKIRVAPALLLDIVSRPDVFPGLEMDRNGVKWPTEFGELLIVADVSAADGGELCYGVRGP